MDGTISSHKWKMRILAIVVLISTAIPVSFGEQQIPKLDDHLQNRLSNESLLNEYFNFSITLTDQSQFKVARLTDMSPGYGYWINATGAGSYPVTN